MVVALVSLITNSFKCSMLVYWGLNNMIESSESSNESSNDGPFNERRKQNKSLHVK